MAKWSGMTVVCMASGPSLTRADVELVKQWRKASNDRRVVVTNTTFKIAPWADVLYAMDAAWWKTYSREAMLKFKGERLSKVVAPGVRQVKVHPSGNSGAGAITLAAQRGAARIILIGYDAKYSNSGKRHWHGDHPKTMGNCVSVGHFPGQVAEVGRHFPRLDIVNASRETALECFPRVDLVSALNGVNNPIKEQEKQYNNTHRPVFITGAARSGTSMTSGLFGQHGVWFGPCMPAARVNPKGFWESTFTKRKWGNTPMSGRATLWTKFLKDNKAPALWGVKTAPDWYPVFSGHDPVVVCCYRSQAKIEDSRKRARFSPNIVPVRKAWERMRAIPDTIDVHPDKFVKGDFSSIIPAFEAIGVEFNEDIAKKWVDPKLWSGN